MPDVPKSACPKSACPKSDCPKSARSYWPWYAFHFAVIGAAVFANYHLEWSEGMWIVGVTASLAASVVMFIVLTLAEWLRDRSRQR